MSKEMTRKSLPFLTVLSFLLAFLLAAAMLPGKVHAEGELGIDGTYKNTYEEGVENTFTLYEVGTYKYESDGSNHLALVDAIGSLPVDVKVDLDINKEDYGEDTDAWTEDWLQSANALWLYLKSDDNKDLRDSLKIGTVETNGGKFSFDVPHNGLYLLVEEGKPKVAEGKGTNGADVTYWARPMFVQVLNERTEIETKLAESQAKHFTVTKTWKDTEGTEILRPDSIDVELLFNDDVVDTITLSKENDWTYQWSTEDEEQFDAGKWECREKLEGDAAYNYAVEPSEKEAGEAKVFNITNVYSRFDLEIEKVTPEYVQSIGKERLDLNDFSAVFRMTGIKDGKEVWHHTAGMQIPGPGRQTIYVPGIPRGLDELKVKEIYSGPNYKPEPAEQTAELVLSQDKMTGTYSVSFKNVYENTTRFDGGVVNKFKKQDGKFKWDDPKNPIETPK